jgi:hemolysin-activating ACP:hemolysin acyltransferase
MHIDKYQAVVDGISLMELGDTHSKYTPSEVNTYLLLPTQYSRIRLYYQDTKPVGLITWCWLSPSKSTLFLEDKYEPVEDDYTLENPEGYGLWGIEFIAPFGHTRRMMKAIREEHKELYGTTTSVHFRRFYNRNKLHKRMF